LVGERPGKVENARGYCFCGPSGEELDRYCMVNAGLDRANCRVCNLVPYYAEEPPTPEEVKEFLPEMWREIEQVQPQFIGLVGLHSARALLGPEIEMEWSHGLAFPVAMKDLEYVQYAMPLYHPAAGLHMPSVAAKIQWDFTQFGKLVRGEKLPTGHLADAYPDALYQESKTYLNLNRDAYTGADTEGTVAKPWGMSVTSCAGTAAVVRTGLVKLESTTVLHNAMHDLPVLEALGVQIGRWTDTMLKAALLGTEPLGLKSLARRHCGMQMQEYSDVVREARREKALEYLSLVVDYASANTDKTA